MANPWFRMYAEFAHDPKVQMLSEVMQRRYVMLMCMRCSNVLVTLQDDEIAFHLRIDTEQLTETKALFIAKGFIDERWALLNWDKRQFASDSSAQRVAKHRAAKKKGGKDDGNSDVTLHETKGNALDTETDTDTENPTTTDVVVVASDADNPVPAGLKRDCPHKEIIALYHEVLPMCPEVREWTPTRAQQLRTRWKEDVTRQDLDYWRRFFEYVRDHCGFLVGKTVTAHGKRPFLADLEWMTKQGNFTKIREGKYAE